MQSLWTICESPLHPTYLKKLYQGKVDGDVNIKKQDEINVTSNILQPYCISPFT